MTNSASWTGRVPRPPRKPSRVVTAREWNEAMLGGWLIVMLGIGVLLIVAVLADAAGLL